MASMGRDVGAETLVRTNMTAAMAGATTNAGAALNIAALPSRPNSVRAIIGVRANLDDGDSATLDNIKLVSDSASNFAAAVTRATASDVTLSAVTGDSNVDYLDAVELDLDLGQLPESHVWLRVSARSTLSDTTNTSGQVFGVLVFGGLSAAPAA